MSDTCQSDQLQEHLDHGMLPQNLLGHSCHARARTPAVLSPRCQALRLESHSADRFFSTLHPSDFYRFTCDPEYAYRLATLALSKVDHQIEIVLNIMFCFAHTR